MYPLALDLAPGDLPGRMGSVPWLIEVTPYMPDPNGKTSISQE